MAASDDIITLSRAGLYCPAGDFYVDPWQPVERAVITHAHGDHARPGSKNYLTSAPGAGVLRRRMGEEASIQTIAYGEAITIGGAIVSLHPAGHVLGSSQVRIEVEGEVWVIAGDYKRDRDPTCEPLELVQCDVFISECTFGLPIFRWPLPDAVFAEVHQWWNENRAANRTSIMYAYTLGKAQRVLAGLDTANGPILVHGALLGMIDEYCRMGVALPDVIHATDETARAHRGKAMVLAPTSAIGSPWLRKFGEYSDGYASGWMRIRGTRRRRSIDRGFVISDHADWPGLHDTIQETGAHRIGVTHGYIDAFGRWLSENGYETIVYPTLFSGELEAEERADAAEIQHETP